LKVDPSRSVRQLKVIPDGKNLVSHAGTALLAELADRSGLTRAMSIAMADCGISWHTYDPGVVLTLKGPKTPMHGRLQVNRQDGGASDVRGGAIDPEEPFIRLAKFLPI